MPCPCNLGPANSRNFYHFSWLALFTEADVAIEQKTVSDPDQVFILREVKHFLNHDNSGMKKMARMHQDWVGLCESIQKHVPLKSNSDSVCNVVTDWMQLQRQLALQLTNKIETTETVRAVYARKYRQDSQALHGEYCQSLVTDNILNAEFEIKDTVSNIRMRVHFLAKSIEFSMEQEPSDAKRQKTVVMDFLKQFSGCSTKDIDIRLHWPGRRDPSATSLEKAINDPDLLLIDVDKNLMPKRFEVYQQTKNIFPATAFVPGTFDSFMTFYEGVALKLLPKKPVRKQPPVLAKSDEVNPDAVTVVLNSDTEADSTNTEENEPAHAHISE